MHSTLPVNNWEDIHAITHIAYIIQHTQHTPHTHSIQLVSVFRCFWSFWVQDWRRHPFAGIQFLICKGFLEMQMLDDTLVFIFGMSQGGRAFFSACQGCSSYCAHLWIKSRFALVSEINSQDTMQTRELTNPNFKHSS